MQPLRAKGQQPRVQIAKPQTLPAPTSGWYVGDNQATPPPKTAIVLDNAFPQLDYVRVRGGSQQWTSGLGGPIASLLAWTNGVNSRMFAVTQGNLYDVSSAGLITSGPALSGLASNYMQGVQFEGYNGTYLVTTTGADPVHIFDGTGWDRTISDTGTLSNSETVTGLTSTSQMQPGMALSGNGIPTGATIASVDTPTQITMSAPATISGSSALTFYLNAPITGYSGAAFSFVWQYKGRLYFVDAQTQNVYYLGLASIGGPATLLPLGAFFTFGGYIIAGGTWAIDSTAGAFKACAFLSSEGEVLMYGGDYPGASNWTLVGSYKISRPLSKYCLMQTGGDLAIMTEDGIVAMSQVMTLDQVALENVAITKPIMPAWRDAVIARAGEPGWQITPWSLQSMAVVNLPKSSTTDYTQYVANMRTGAWCRYTGWDANCFCVCFNSLFYGDSHGGVWQAETGGSDAGATPYTTTIMLGFSQLGAPAVVKHVLLVRPYVQAANPLNPQVTIKIDYDVTIPPAPAPAPLGNEPLWDVAVWDVDVWGGGLLAQSAWVDAQGLGTAISVCYQITTQLGATTPDVRIAAFDVLSESGNIGLG